MAEKLLTVRQVQTAGEGDHSDGGGLMLRVRGASASWVLRHTAPSGRRREMGLRAARRGNSKETGDSLTGAREGAARSRALLQAGLDPIDEREHRRAARGAGQEGKEGPGELDVGAGRARLPRAGDRAREDVQACGAVDRLPGNHWPPIWHKPTADIEPPELRKPMQDMRSLEDKRQRIPETLQRVRQRLDAVFEDAFVHRRSGGPRRGTGTAGDIQFSPTPGRCGR